MNGGQYLEVQVAYALGFKGEPNTSGVKYENDRSDECYGLVRLTAS